MPASVGYPWRNVVAFGWTAGVSLVCIDLVQRRETFKPKIFFRHELRSVIQRHNCA
ncbi:hypothetical protein SAMN05414139_00128 [Burkholderia sp. D7]|nr:hypothetical protein SAMN05414139_00128 [Burkholderia sp. D7]